MLSFFEFLDEITAAVANILDGVKVYVIEGKPDRLCIDDGTGFSPAFNLETMYEIYSSGCDIGRIAADLAEQYKSAMKEREQIESLNCFEKNRNRIFPVVMNKENNLDRIEQGIVYREENDYFFAYRVMIGNEDGTSSTVLTKALLDSWDVSVDEIDSIAWKNAAKLQPAKLTGIVNVLNSIATIPREDFEDFEQANDAMYVLSNQACLFGASTLWYPGQLEKIHDELGEDFYVLPSSVHEVICLRGTGVNVDVLKDMVSSVNNSEVLPRDKFSDHVFHYSKGGKLSVVA